MPRKQNLGSVFDAGGDTAVLDAPPKKAKAATPMPADDTKRIKIILEENENIPPTGQFISRNGNGVVLRPGEEADVPMWVTRVLDDAKQLVPQIDPSTNQITGYREKLRFPYRVVRQG